jgi:hypothetical protein
MAELQEASHTPKLQSQPPPNPLILPDPLSVPLARPAGKTVMTSDSHILEELDSKTKPAGSAQSKLKAMWNKIRTTIMVNYIMLVDNCIIVVWFSVMLLNVYTVRLAYLVLFRGQS